MAPLHSLNTSRPRQPLQPLRLPAQGLFSMLNPQQLVGMDNYGPMYEQVVSITALEMMMLCCL